MNRFAVMYIFCRKKLLFLLMASLLACSVKSQKTHFVYLQTDNGQPFYVKINQKVISSSAQGYVILPGVSDGDLQLAIGFPKKEHPEETFSLNISNNEGFVIKNFEDNATQLFNLQTLSLVKGTDDSPAAQTAGTKDSDTFSTMLANVVKDSSILQDHQIQAASPAPAETGSPVVIKENVATVSKSDSSIDSSVTTTSKVPEVSIAPEVANVTPTNNDSVRKILSNENESGLTMLYSEKSANQTDTVSVFIPIENAMTETENDAVAENKNPVISSSTTEEVNAPDSSDKNQNDKITSSTASTNYSVKPTVVKQPEVNNGFVFRKDTIASSESNTRPVQVFTIGPAKDKHEKKSEEKEEKTDEKNSRASAEKAPKAELILLPKVSNSSSNSDCKTFATNEDFLRLRKKLAAENDEDNMIRTAQKFFRSKCFSTEQIKDLSYLFLTDEGKYQFFDAAYAHTSDSDQYETLESQLSDPYYLNRFKAMLRK